AQHEAGPAADVQHAQACAPAELGIQPACGQGAHTSVPPVLRLDLPETGIVGRGEDARMGGLGRGQGGVSWSVAPVHGLSQTLSARGVATTWLLLGRYARRISRQGRPRVTPDQTREYDLHPYPVRSDGIIPRPPAR